MKSPPKTILLTIEFLTLFLLIPLTLYFTGSRLGIYAALWGAGLYAFVALRHAPDFSWRKLWRGEEWTFTAKRNAFIRFLILAAVLLAVTLVLVPEKFMRFPLDRFPLWLAVMVLYPILSVVPQELFFPQFLFSSLHGHRCRKTVRHFHQRSSVRIYPHHLEQLDRAGFLRPGWCIVGKKLSAASLPEMGGGRALALWLLDLYGRNWLLFFHRQLAFLIDFPGCLNQTPQMLEGKLVPSSFRADFHV